MRMISPGARRAFFIIHRAAVSTGCITFFTTYSPI
jgi:hypothetical protein